MRKLTLISLLTLLILALSACTAANGGEQTTSPTPPAAPEADKATVVGRVFSNTDDQPMTTTLVRLAEVVRQGDQAAFILDAAFSPGAQTDANGYFIIENIAPMEYVLIIGNHEVYQGYEIIAGADGRAKTYIVEAGQVFDFEEIRVNLPHTP